MGLPIKLKLPDGFLQEENRCGANVPEKLKRIWAVELDLLHEFLELCKQHQIQVQVFAGTLLGAVRHKGFIPWDDDVDVCMDRDNFSKLLKIPPELIPAPYFLQTALSDRRFFCPYARFRNSQTTAVINGSGDLGYNNGIYIDVFVLDGYVSGSFLRKVQGTILELIHMILVDFHSVIPRCRTFVSRTLRLLRPLFKVIGYVRLFRVYNWVIAWFTKGADRVSFMTHGDPQMSQYWMYKEELQNTILLDFEGMKVPATKFFDKVLSRTYGNYMGFPPVAERGKWHEGQIAFDPDTPYTEWLKRQLNKT